MNRGAVFDHVFVCSSEPFSPLTFSSSKRMDETVEVQRYPVALFARVRGWVASGSPGGLFDPLEGFELDEAVSQARAVEPLVARDSVPEDFKCAKNVRHVLVLRPR